MGLICWHCTHLQHAIIALTQLSLSLLICYQEIEALVWE